MSIVSELQQEALDEKGSVTGLLRKALVVALKLDHVDFAAWIERELNGYDDKTLIPAYRELRGAARVHNPYRGYIPLNFGSAKLAERCSKMTFHYPISQFESILADGDSGDFACTFSPEWEQRLMDAMTGPPMTPSLHFDKSQVRGILDTVRTAVLKWAVELEKKGIQGTGLTFSRQEKEKATPTSTTFNIETYIGSMHQSQLQKDVQSSVQTLTVKDLDLEAVRKVIAQVESALRRAPDVPADKMAELQADVATIKAQLEAPKPKQPIIRECLTSIRSVIEEAGGSLLATGILAAISVLIPG